MVWKECVICGAGFEAVRRAITCSDLCSHENNQKVRLNYRVKNRKLLSQKQHIYAVKKGIKGKFGPPQPKQRQCSRCGEVFVTILGQQKYCRDLCFDLSQTEYQKIRDKNREKHPKYGVKSYLKRQLGTEPPADLVEEAAALRLLNRALRESS